MENNFTYYNDLISKYFSNEASGEEIVNLKLWIEKSPDNFKVFEDYHKTWLIIERLKIDNNTDINYEWQSFKNKIEEKPSTISIVNRNYKPPKLINTFIKIAAIIIVVCICSIVVYNLINQTSTIKIQADNKVIEQKLPDGSIVTVNENSTIEYKDKFDKNKRAVALNGEAFFSVTHDPSMPFIVSAGNVRIEVLGTEFNVNTNAENNTVSVYLVSGKVSLYYENNEKEKVILSPGEKAEISKTYEEINIIQNPEVNSVSWKTHRFVFNDTPIRQIIILLNKTYSVNVQLSNPEIGNCRISATFDNQNPESILKVISETLDLKLSKSNSGYQLTGNGCK